MHERQQRAATFLSCLVPITLDQRIEVGRWIVRFEGRAYVVTGAACDLESHLVGDRVRRPGRVGIWLKIKRAECFKPNGVCTYGEGDPSSSCRARDQLPAQETYILWDDTAP